MYLTLAAEPALQSHSPMEQSGPIQLGSQLHSPVSGMKAPWPWHWSGHWALGSSQWSPPQPGLQWHSPFTQMPLLEHVGSMQSTGLSQQYTNLKEKKQKKKEINKQTKKCHYRADDKNKLMVVFKKKTDVTEDIISLCVYKKIMK